MAIENPTKYVSVQRLRRFEEKLGQKYATQTAMAAAVADVTPDYIDIEDLTPGMTFPKNSLLAINGVLYQAKKTTTQFPVVVLVENGHVVYDEDENGRKALVVSDYTMSTDWKIWGDASVTRTIEQFESSVNNEVGTFEGNMTQQMAAFKAQVNNLVGQAIRNNQVITSSSGQQYTAEQLLQAMAELMNKTVVADPTT